LITTQPQTVTIAIPELKQLVEAAKEMIENLNFLQDLEDDSDTLIEILAIQKAIAAAQEAIEGAEAANQHRQRSQPHLTRPDGSQADRRSHLQSLQKTPSVNNLWGHG
jgi:hypothetical protein